MKRDKKKSAGAPHRHVVISLKKDLERALNKGHDILIFADANESLERAKPHLHNTLKDLGLINVFEAKFGNRLPPTCSRSSSAIDHIWCTERIFNSITRCGILSIDKLIVSDHRMLWIDLNISSIFCDKEELITSFDKRRLKYNNVKVRKEFLTQLDKISSSQGLPKRALILQQLLNDESLLHNQQKIDNLITFTNTFDQQLYDAKIGAHNRLSHIYTMYWTPTLNENLKRTHELCQLITKYKKQTRIAGINNVNNIKTAKKELKELDDWFNNRDMTAKQLRKEFLEEDIQDRVDEGKFKTITAARKVLKNVETQRDDAKQLGKVLKPFREGGLTYILVPAPSEYPEELRNKYLDPDVIWNRIEVDQGEDIEDWERITTKGNLESMLIHWQQLHFSQASATPLASRSWIDKINNTSTIEEISDLDEYNELDDSTQAVLQEIFKHPENHEQYTMSFSDFKSFFTNKDEKTSASPSGIHYGFWKSISNHNMLYWHFLLIQATIKIGYVPIRWRRTTTTLVKKKPGVPRIHRLRPIHIIEPEIQFISHHFWSTLFMRKAERLNLITDSQFGGRRGRQSQHAVIKQVLIWDIARLQQLYMASHLADAHANFDRNMSHIVGKVLFSQGMEPKIVHFYQEYLRKQVFNLRTSYGISEDSYTNNEESPLFGNGQGIGWSSPNQIVISTIVDSVYSALATVFHIKRMDDMFEILSGVNFFIDDRISNTINHNGDTEQLLTDFQHNETKQVEILNATGGAIAPKKCKWWMLCTKEGSLGSDFEKIKDDEYTLLLQNTGDDHPYSIERLDISHSEKYLGCIINPTLDPKDQINKIEDIIATWCERTLHSDLSPRQVLKGYKDYLLPKLAYPMITTNISYNECNRLMGKIRKVLATKTKYHTGTSLFITHGPTHLLGEDLPHLYDFGGSEKLAYLFFHLRNGKNKHDTVSRGILTSFLHHMLWLGVSENFLNLDFDKWGFLFSNSRTWLILIWKYLHHYRNQLDITDLPTYHLPCEGDFFLMKYLIDVVDNKKKLLMFNKVRVHFCLYTVSDMLLADGEKFHPDLFTQTNFDTRTSSFNWP